MDWALPRAYRHWDFLQAASAPTIAFNSIWAIIGRFAPTSRSPTGCAMFATLRALTASFLPFPQLNNLFPGLGNRVRQPNLNFAPMLGFAWDPSSNSKTSIRGGVGLYYENAIWNNVLYDAPQREATGSFLQQISPCNAPGQPNELQTSNGTLNQAGSQSAIAICGPSGASSFPLIGNALPAIIALQQAYIAGSPFNLQTPNPNFVGTTLAGCSSLPSSQNYAGCYFTPGLNMFD